MKPTNLHLKDTACLHVVHIFQHPKSRPTTKSTKDTMVNAPKKNLSPLQGGKDGKSTKKSTQQRHQVNKGDSGLEAERVRALGALRSLQSEKKLWVENRWETHFLSDQEKETWIEDYVDRDTTVARN